MYEYKLWCYKYNMYIIMIVYFTNFQRRNCMDLLFRGFVWLYKIFSNYLNLNSI